MKNVLCVIVFILFTTTLFAQNNCLELDGSEDYVALGSEGSFDFETTLTIELWMYANTFATWTGIITKGDNAWRLQGKSNGYLNFCTGFNEEVETDYDVRGGWIHVACVAVGSSLKIYLNGKLNATAGYDGGIDLNNYSVLIGENAQATGRYFDGLIDEVRIWSDDRSVTEIRQNMYRELNGDEDGLVAYYKCNEESGTSLDDATSSEIDGTLTNMAGNEWMNSGAFAGPRRCLDFDGNDDYVDCGTSLSVSGNITVSAWIYSDGVTPSNTTYYNDYIVTKGNDDDLDNSFGIAIAGESVYHAHMMVNTTQGTYWAQSPAGSIETGRWYYITGVISGTDLYIYIDGIQMGHTTISGSLASSSLKLNIGKQERTNYEYFFHGSIDEVRIWNDARTDQEIREYMCRTLDGDEDNLVAYYRFDQQPTSGQTTLYDITSNENSGTLTNMDATTDWVTCTAFDTWIGWYDTAWSEAKNWSRGIPTSTENVGIFKWTLGHAPTVGSSSSAKTLVIGLLETLTLNSGLTIDGNLFELGNLLHNNQTVTCAGSSAQYLFGSLDFYDLTIDNSSSDKKVSAWWTTSLSVSNNLTISDGAFYSKSDYNNVSIASDGTLELSGNITVSGNWDNDGTFTHNDHKVTFDGDASQTIQGDNPTTFYDLTVNNTSGVVLGNSNTVNHTLDLNSDSKITLGTNTLTIGSSGSISNYDSDAYIVTNGSGVLKRNSVGSGPNSFPVGNSSYNPVWINNSGTADNFSVKVADGTPSNISDATRVVNRTWTITEDAAEGSNVALMWQKGTDTAILKI